jgi:methylenetetrahydrofolate dehydrogenase (NADP+)/methenyltetrahydrofolate cyclohydrolase
MKLLNGQDLADYIQERQAHDVRFLVQSHGVQPKLAIVRCNMNPVVDSYMRLKTAYGQDVGVVVDVHEVDQNKALSVISELNSDDSVHGVIVQLPLPDISQTDRVLDSVDVAKDVDGLATSSQFDAPTPTAINWLLAGNGLDLKNKSIVIVGNGRLVGKPLARLWHNSKLDVTVIDSSSSVTELAIAMKSADIIVTATGVPGLITPDMIKSDVVIVDAGVATDSNGLVGDVATEVRELPGITITPEKGGVGPLTICALFENVIRAATPITS